MKNKKDLFRIGAIILIDLLIFFVVTRIHTYFISLKVQAIQEAIRGNSQNILLEVITHPFVLYSVTYFFQLLPVVWINKKFLKTKKEIIVVYGVILLVVLSIILELFWPGFMKYLQCRQEISIDHNNVSGECWTFIDNFRVHVIYVLFVLYTSVYVGIGIFINFSLLHHKGNIFSKILSGSLVIFIPILLLLLPRLFIPKSVIQVAPRDRSIIREIPISDTTTIELSPVPTRIKTIDLAE